MADVTMPRLSDTMEEGKILRWLKQQGDRVEVGDLLVEVETDKADMEVEASIAGVLREVKLGEGESAAVGAVIAVIEDGAASAADGKSGAARSSGEQERPGGAGAERKPSGEQRPAGEEATAARPSPRGAAAERDRQPAQPARAERAEPERAPASRVTSAARSGPATPAPARTRQEIKASPLARSLAEQLGVDLSTVRGTGPAGRITQRDVEEAHARGGGAAAAAKPSRQAAGKADEADDAAAGAAESTPEPEPEHGGTRAGAAAGGATDLDAAGRAPSPPKRARGDAGDAARAGGRAKDAPADGERARADGERASTSGGVRREPLSRMRASIAKRMSESMREAPHFYLTTVVDMDEAVRLRAQLKALEASPGVTYNHMVLKAVADALARFPEVNARFAGDAIELLHDVNLGIATAVDDGLIVPVLAGADRLGLLDIATQARALAEKAESGKFTSADLSGATFSVSNLGMFDVDSFSAVINPPQAAILAVGSVKQRPVVRDGALAVGHTMALTLSCDHRVIDGARGGRFLAEVKRRLENPASLLLSGMGGA